MAAIDKTYITEYRQYREIADWCKAQGRVTDSYGNELVPYEYIPHMSEMDEETMEWKDLGEWTEEYFDNWIGQVRKDNSERYKTEEYWREAIKGDHEYLLKYDTFDKWCEYVDTWAEVPLWNTDHVFDVYLIRNCPVRFIQDRLKEQYGGGWSKAAFSRHDLSYEAIKACTSMYDTYVRNGLRTPKFKVVDRGSMQYKDSGIKWWIEVVSDSEQWGYDEEADRWYCDSECYMPKGDCWTTASVWNYRGNMSPGRIRRLLRRWNLPAGCVVKFSGDVGRVCVKEFDVVLKGECA